MTDKIMNTRPTLLSSARFTTRLLRRTAQTACAGALLAVLAACGGGDDTPATAGRANMQVVAFGDSLSDAGTYAKQVQHLFGGGGRFTTNPGQVFTQEVAAYYGNTLTPAFEGGVGVPLQAAGGLDYAQGGARVSQQPGIGHAPEGTPNADYAGATTVPVATQVQQYLQQHGSFNSNQIVLVTVGEADILYQMQAVQTAGNTPAAQQAAGQAVGAAAQQLAGIIQQIVAAGATHVFVANTRDMGQTPVAVAAGAQGAFTQMSQLFNGTLAASLKALNVDPAKVAVLDLFTWANNIAANAKTYGFSVTNTGTACNLQAMEAAGAAAGAPDPSVFAWALFCSPPMYTTPDADQTYMFADPLHPSTRMHTLLAQYVKQQIAAAGISR
ncbi:Phospholipase/lecithinase/hemolysin [Burkholderia singularis]|uniref:Phospholipase/lecithinase/hemolysin n=2 Tax=Burkholderiaceae TaxID=119060 RepID=A0A238HD28_9BURK|nr:Phospholipase/lecithinase/hemolysin [Burkholderia singularis]